ncbi:MAG: glycine/sarcosine/betaine reductase selenoprotein B family protein [Myxococcota bacterium]
MGDLSEFSLATRLFLRTYRWRVIDPVPWTPLRVPLARARLALVSSAGFVLPFQEPFDERVRGGDPSFREIPFDTEPSTLVDTHRSESFDHEAMRRDPNLAFPLERVRELEARGRIGAVNQRHWSFMGSLTAPGRFVAESLPRMAEAAVGDGVDAALLVPV